MPGFAGGSSDVRNKLEKQKLPPGLYKGGQRQREIYVAPRTEFANAAAGPSVRHLVEPRETPIYPQLVAQVHGEEPFAGHAGAGT